jgi:MFS family permease
LKYLSRTVWTLSLISLFTDIASEMLYPVMPIYLRSIGFSILLIGILEGIAEAVAGFSKGYFGKLSDQTGKRTPLIRLGYTLSALSKPMMAFFIYPLWIFFARTVDRLGKGIRTGARDALLSDEATPATKGRVFGFHRGMDTLGAVAGPALALLYLYLNPGRYRPLFLLAFIPGMLAVLISFLLKDKESSLKVNIRAVPVFSFLHYWRQSPLDYRKLVVGLLVFTLCNSSDVFLLLKIKQAGLNDMLTIGVYIFYNVIYALASYPWGILADKMGLKNIFVAGLILFTVVYAGMGFHGSLYFYGVLFMVYGIYAAATEGISKAWISNITDKSDTATAIGMYTGFQSICTMLASFVTGWVWYTFGSAYAFWITASITVVVILYFLIYIPKPVIKSEIP